MKDKGENNMWEVKIKTFVWLQEKMTVEKAELEFEFDTFEEAGVFCDMVINHSNIDTFEIKKKGA